jgi:hypothetical protein
MSARNYGYYAIGLQRISSIYRVRSMIFGRNTDIPTEIRLLTSLPVGEVVHDHKSRNFVQSSAIVRFRCTSTWSHVFSLRTFQTQLK